MVELLRQSEERPTDMPESHSAALWLRIEAYIAYRHYERAVTWIVRGPGDWVPPLAPATIDTTEVWNGSGWDTGTLFANPIGYELGPYTYRITATVGASNEEIPDAIYLAFRRLRSYVAEAKQHGISAAKVSTETQYQPHDIAPHLPPDRITSESQSVERSQTWMARAMQYSGAADLLRPYRRVR